jgi:hypothetical protein
MNDNSLCMDGPAAWCIFQFVATSWLCSLFRLHCSSCFKMVMVIQSPQEHLSCFSYPNDVRHFLCHPFPTCVLFWGRDKWTGPSHQGLNYEMDTGYEGVQNATVLWSWILLMRFLRKDIRVGGVLGTCFYYQLTTSWFHHARTVFPSVDRAYLCEFHNKG